MLQTSGPIDLQDIQAEFGGSNPIELDEYYRGGAYVSASAPAGSGSFQTAPLTPASGVQIPTSGTIQMSHFYGTQDLIIGNSGIITAPANNAATSDFVDVTLPAGVEYIRFYLVGAGGGGGGKDSRRGGTGGGGATISGTINTSWAGSINQNRTLRFFIGRGGAPGFSDVDGNSTARPAPRGGHGYPLAGHVANPWSAWLNSYGVSWEQAGLSYAAASVTSDRMIYFPVGGNYQFQFLVDNHLKIFVDGFEVANTDSGLNDQGWTANNSYTLGSPLTRTVSVFQGWRKIRFQYTNTADVGAYGVRIVNLSGGAEIWNTRNDYATSNTHCYPCGGNGGYAGSSGNSGYGGGGGSATKLTLVMPSGAEYLIAIAGGGGGGGGGGRLNGPNVDVDANWATQGWEINAFPTYAAGNEGEYVTRLNGASSYPPEVDNDGGGGGGGGGGIVNTRMYPLQGDRQWYYSGFGGRTRRGTYYSAFDGDADGGESGKSGVTSFATRYANFVHANTTTSSPHFPSGMPVSLASYGLGGAAANPNPATAGIDGAAYVDWGVTDNTVGSVSITRSPLRASAIPYDTYLTSTGVFGPGTHRIEIGSNSYSSFTADAWGGGGNPGSNYTYSWSNAGGDPVSFGSPNSHRTTVNVGNTPNTSGTVRCTVSDGTSTATADITWIVYDDTFSGGGGDGDGG